MEGDHDQVSVPGTTAVESSAPGSALASSVPTGGEESASTVPAVPEEGTEKGSTHARKTQKNLYFFNLLNYISKHRKRVCWLIMYSLR